MPSASPDTPVHRATPDPSGRPPLPQRSGQSHLAPQLQQPVPAHRDEPAGEHDPQLMAAFRHGFSQAEAGTDEGDGTLNHPDRIS
jgi:hypothetical protein